MGLRCTALALLAALAKIVRASVLDSQGASLRAAIVAVIQRRARSRRNCASLASMDGREPHPRTVRVYLPRDIAPIAVPWSAAVGFRLRGELVYVRGQVVWFGLAQGSA